MIRSGSNSIFTPSPWHSSQAPNGLLNENIRGWSSSNAIPQTGQAMSDEYVDSFPSSSATSTSPPDFFRQFSTASASRVRSEESSRSITISMSCILYRSSLISSSVRMIFPLTRTRVKPSLLRSFKSCWYVPFFCRTMGARTVTWPGCSAAIWSAILSGVWAAMGMLCSGQNGVPIRA